MRVKYALPEGFDYPAEVKKQNFVGCPVCKKGNIKKDLIKQNIYACDFCSAKLKNIGPQYLLSTEDCISEYKNFKYDDCKFSIFEWNNIALSGRTLRENTLEVFRKGTIPHIDNSLTSIGLVLKPDEYLSWFEKSNLYEPRSERTYAGGSRGVSFRVAKGVSIRSGGFSGHSESHEAIQLIDTGKLILTNKRLIFIGQKRSANIEFKRILSTTFYKDSFKIDLENRQRPQLFGVSDSEFWEALLSGAVKVSM
jgi:hypothetical protein